MLCRRKTSLALFGVVVYSILMTLLMSVYRDYTKRSAQSDKPTSYNVTSPVPFLASRNAALETATKQTQVITLFTTFKNLESKTVAYRNTIRNWGLLAPSVRPVLYYTFGEDYLTEFARMNGWAVYRCPKVSNSGVPVLRSMYLHAQAINNTTPFYGYANSDILFDRKLVATLEVLKDLSGDRSKHILVIGRRTNYRIRYNQEIYDLASVSRYASAGSLFSNNAQDYFIYSHSGFPWESIPDFVVGRVGYDNWLVATAIRRNLTVVDATESVTALHQTGSDGNHAGRDLKRLGDEKFVNYRLAGKFDYSIGITTCAHVMTIWNPARVLIIERVKNRKQCVVSSKHMSYASKQVELLRLAYLNKVKSKKTNSKSVQFRLAKTKLDQFQLDTYNPSHDLSVTPNPNQVLVATFKHGQVQPVTHKSNQARFPTSKPRQVQLPTAAGGPSNRDLTSNESVAPTLK